MRLAKFLMITLSAVMVQSETLIDLSTAVSQDFPTNRVSVSGCYSAYDNKDKKPPHYCKPFPVTIQSVKLVASNGISLLHVQIINESDHTISLPASVQQTSGEGAETFITLAIYSLSKPSTSLSVSFAYANSAVASSMVNVHPNHSITYELPAERLIQGQRSNTAQEFEVRLTAYSLKRGAKRSDDNSSQTGNPLVSEPFAISVE